MKLIPSSLELDEDDWERIQASETHLSDRIPEIVDELYRNFMNDDGTAEFYRNEDGSFDAESYEHRIEGFEYWFDRIFDADPDAHGFREFLSSVGSIHTEQMGFEEMDVPVKYMTPTFSFLFDRISAILGDRMDDSGCLSKTLSAWNRFFMLQLSIMHEAREQ